MVEIASISVPNGKIRYQSAEFRLNLSLKNDRLDVVMPEDFNAPSTGGIGNLTTNRV